MSDRLDAILRRELWPLTAREKARLIALGTRASTQVYRGKSTGTADRRMDAVWAEAAARVQAEEAARAAAEDAKRAAKAKAKADRKAKGWW